MRHSGSWQIMAKDVFPVSFPSFLMRLSAQLFLK